jgi:hypothetical protein
LPNGYQWSVFSGQDEVSFLVFDASGRSMYSRQIEKGLNILQSPNLQTGIYFYVFVKDSMILHQGKVITR